MERFIYKPLFNQFGLKITFFIILKPPFFKNSGLVNKMILSPLQALCVKKFTTENTEKNKN